MYVAKRGKTAPKIERRRVFAAMAEAALERCYGQWGDLWMRKNAAGIDGWCGLQHEI